MIGLVIACWPVSQFVVEISGYVVPFTVPWKAVAESLAAALVIGFLASWIPARQASGVGVLEAISYE